MAKASYIYEDTTLNTEETITVTQRYPWLRLKLSAMILPLVFERLLLFLSGMRGWIPRHI
jgi:hypothetical protein